MKDLPAIVSKPVLKQNVVADDPSSDCQQAFGYDHTMWTMADSHSSNLQEIHYLDYTVAYIP